ncbi:MAG: hypothetical protein AVDCRST_MAG93-1852, partial [uncultured Chloroflexia bacterium]
RRYLFTTVTSNTLLPFVILEDQLPTVLLPIEFREDTIRILSNQQLLDRGDEAVAEWFDSIDHALDDEPKGEKKIRQRIDERRKLTLQNFAGARFLVHHGAGGAIP